MSMSPIELSATGFPIRRARRRFSRNERAELVAQIRHRKESTGQSLRVIADELGLKPALVYRWMADGVEAGFLPVSLFSVSAPVLVTPGGFRVEGLDLRGLAQLVRLLS